MPSLRDNLRRQLDDLDNSGSRIAQYRRRRWDALFGLFPDLASMRVLDLGGRPSHWSQCPVRPAHIVILNLEDLEPEPGMDVVHGDACHPPTEIASEHFDLVYSNSLIEHVGGYAHRVELADQIHRLSPRHWVQTPYRYFPIEPHWMIPGLQFLPLPARARAAQFGPWGRVDPRQGVGRVLAVELLTRTEMEYLFPDSEIVSERAFGLCKSLIAVRG